MRAGHLAGAALVLVGLAGLWHSAQATAAPAPTAPVAAPVRPSASRAGIAVTGAYLTRQGPANALAYFTVSNRGGSADFLTGISADEVAHDATLYLGGGEITTGTLTVGPGSSDRLAPGGPHVRLGLHGPLTPGQPVTLTLTFSRAGTINVRAVVR